VTHIPGIFLSRLYSSFYKPRQVELSSGLIRENSLTSHFCLMVFSGCPSTSFFLCQHCYCQVSLYSKSYKNSYKMIWELYVRFCCKFLITISHFTQFTERNFVGVFCVALSALLCLVKENFWRDRVQNNIDSYLQRCICSVNVLWSLHPLL
jgi:hypothetical protein